MKSTALSADTRLAPYQLETVRWVRHWNDKLFSFAITRSPAFRFRSGEFVMLGLDAAPKPIMRAYSIASPHFADELEFLSIKVEDGPLTTRLREIRAGDGILLTKKPTGTLVLDALTPGRRLYLLATGTGLAPFLSIVRDPEAFERFEQVVLVHCVRRVSELAQRELLEKDLFDDPLVGALARGRFIYLPTVTREPFPRSVRITRQIDEATLFAELGLEQRRFDPAVDRVMACGGMEMIIEVSAMLERQGMIEGAKAAPGAFVIERAFVG